MYEGRGTWLASAVALFFSWAALTFLVRLYVKLNGKSWGSDDATFSAGFAVAGMHVASTFWALRYGYGAPLDELSVGNKDQVYTSLYASQIFYVVAVGLSKISSALFIGRLTRNPPQIRLAHILAAVSGAWTIVSMFVVAFRGNLTHPWTVLDGFQPMYLRWLGIEITGLVLELALWSLSIHLVWGLKMTLRKRIVILSAFAARLLLLPIVIVRLLYLSPAQNTNPTFTSILPAIITEAALEFSFISASVTSVRPFFRPFHSGPIHFVNTVGTAGSGLRSGNHTTSSEGGYYKLGAMENNSSKDETTQTVSLAPLAKPEPDLAYPRAVVSATGRNQRSSKVQQKDDVESLRSTSGSDQMIIRKTTDWTVRYDVEGSG